MLNMPGLASVWLPEANQIASLLPANVWINQMVQFAPELTIVLIYVGYSKQGS